MRNLIYLTAIALIGVLTARGFASELTLDVDCETCAYGRTQCVVKAQSSNGLRYYNQTAIRGEFGNDQKCELSRNHFMKFDNARYWDQSPYDSDWYVFRTLNLPLNCNCAWISDSRYSCNRATDLWITDRVGVYLKSKSQTQLDNIEMVCRNGNGAEIRCSDRDRFDVQEKGTNTCQNVLPYLEAQAERINFIRY